MRPRLIATDLDGTLVRDDGTVSARTRDVLAELESRGIATVFVTARPMRWMTPLVELVGGHGVAILSNGAVEYDLANAQILTVRGLAPEQGRPLAGRIREVLPSAAFALESVSGFAKEAHFHEGYPLPEGYRTGPLEEVWDEPALKVLVRCPDVPDAVARPLIAQAVADLGQVSWSTHNLVEIAAPGVTKASALADLCRRWRVSADEVVAFGDMPNDLEMLSWAGTSYAMANADPSVLAAASAITPYSNNHDGVARALELLLGLDR